MAQGEQKFNSGNVEVKRFTNDPIPKGMYALTLLKEMSVRRNKDNPGNSVPRISCRFSAGGTAKDATSKDKLVFFDFFLSLKPGKDGVVMPARGGQIVEYARAHGDELEDIDVLTMEVEDDDGNKTKVRYLSPEQVMEYLEGKVGATVTGKVTIEAERAEGKTLPISDKNPGRNKIEHWSLDESRLSGENEVAEEEEEAPKAAKSKLPTKKKK